MIIKRKLLILSVLKIQLLSYVFCKLKVIKVGFKKKKIPFLSMQQRSCHCNHSNELNTTYENVLFFFAIKQVDFWDVRQETF